MSARIPDAFELEVARIELAGGTEDLRAALQLHDPRARREARKSAAARLRLAGRAIAALVEKHDIENERT